MEDVTDASFRLLCRKMGAAMVYSEFVSADAIVRLVDKTLAKLSITPQERPAAVQIYGRDAETMARAACIVESYAHPDIIDINFGCPVKKIAGKGAGAALLRDIPRMLDITRAVVNAVSVPVTVKTRLGWDAHNIVIEQLAEQLQDCGIAALSIHGRTRAAMYSGPADWEPIAAVKSNPRIQIPIIGNGDIDSADRAYECFQRYGVDAVMIGRATFGRPWIFREIAQILGTPLSVDPVINSPYPTMSLDWKIDVLKYQILQSIQTTDERRGIIHSRRHIAATPLFKNIPDFRPVRTAMLRADTLDSLFNIIESSRQLVSRFA